MRALIISPQPFFSPRGTPFSVYYRTMITSEQGVEIDLLTYGEGQDVDLQGVRIIRIPRFKFIGNVPIGPSFVKLFLDLFMFLWTVILLCKNKYEIVHAHEEAIFFSFFLKSIFKFKLIYDMHSSLPQQLSNFEFTTSKLLIGIFKKLEDVCLKRSDAIITICPDLSDYVNSQIKDKEKHFLIENSIFEDVKVVNRQKDGNNNEEFTDRIVKLSIKSPLIVYAGTLEPYQGIDVLIESFKKALVIDENLFLVVVGGTSSQVKKYHELSQKNGILSNCVFLGRVDQKFAKFCINKASVLVSPRVSGTNTPLKIYEQLASGIPLVATNIYSHTQVLNKDVAILVNPDPESMAAGIIEALSNKGDRIKKSALSLYNQKYSKPVYVNKIKQILKLFV